MNGVRFQAIVFDLDGTLVDSTQDISAAINRLRSFYNLAPLAIEKVRQHLGDGASLLIDRCFPERPADVHAMLGAFREDYRQNCLVATTLYPGVADLLPQLSRHCRLGVLTNKDRSMSVTILEGLGLLPFLDAVVGGDGPCLKPCPDGLLSILEGGGIPPSASLMVGDHHTDLEAARRAGAPSAFCEYGYGSRGSEHPDYLLRSFADLKEIVLLP